MIPIDYYLWLSAVLFTIGVLGVLYRRNAIIIFMCIELMLNAVNLTLIAFSQFLGDQSGQILVFFVMTVAAAEAAAVKVAAGACGLTARERTPARGRKKRFGLRSIAPAVV